MAIRQRTWSWKGRDRIAWVVDYFDANGKRRLKMFRTKRAVSTEMQAGASTSSRGCTLPPSAAPNPTTGAPLNGAEILQTTGATVVRREVGPSWWWLP